MPTDIEKVADFFANPQLKDIIAYIMVLVSFALQFIQSKSTKTLNLDTRFKFIEKAAEFLGAKEELQTAKQLFDTQVERFRNERDSLKREFEKERDDLLKRLADTKKELNDLKKVVEEGFSSVEGLVKNGVARKISKKLLKNTENEEGEQ